MRVLVVGGTKFVGRHIVAAAIEAGHDVALLHRGRTGAGLFLDAEHRLADRDDTAALSAALADGVWDATLDVSAYLPRQVTALADALDGRGGRYVFVSTTSVYDPRTAGFTEDGRVVGEIDPEPETVTDATYGPLKVGCERLARERFHAPLVIRPTYVIGPWDHSQRFDYWVQRIARGGEVLAPGDADAPMQVIDARDLADFVVASLATGRVGTFHLVGASATYTFGDLLDDIATGVGATDTTVTWVENAFLRAAGETARTLPLWSAGDPVEDLASTADPAASLAAGLRVRPVADSARDVLVGGRPLERFMTRDREAELLRRYLGQGS
ncbi:NAD-dependent epimerase/dehydratase family protein [Phytohabitans sp. LJ34]|uniref:NAD-dependent epimerase/dehydratase family protein n=1 Tax=Phytohabitans sp. LJ34 TaxID=3452217 RepID=UPI003F8B2697